MKKSDIVLGIYSVAALTVSIYLITSYYKVNKKIAAIEKNTDRLKNLNASL